MSEFEFQDKISYQFSDNELLKIALTHSSYFNEKKNGLYVRNKSGKDNERLEFLGDAILDAVISDTLYVRQAEMEEGVLTKIRASIVCEGSLANCARNLELGTYLYMSKGEEHMGGRQRDSILADAVEAIIGAIYLDGGWEAAKAFVLSIFETTIEAAISGKLHSDFKTDIQEILQARGGKIHYEIEREEGPDHNKTFYANLMFNGQVIGVGSGKTKKEAEQNAAREAIERGEGVVF